MGAVARGSFWTKSAYASGHQASDIYIGRLGSRDRSSRIAFAYHSCRAEWEGGLGSFKSSIPTTLDNGGSWFWRSERRADTNLHKIRMVSCRLDLDWKKDMTGEEVPECESSFCFPGAACRSTKWVMKWNHSPNVGAYQRGHRSHTALQSQSH